MVANIHEFEVIGDPRPSQYGFLSDQESKYDRILIFNFFFFRSLFAQVISVTFFFL